MELTELDLWGSVGSRHWYAHSDRDETTGVEVSSGSLEVALYPPPTFDATDSIYIWSAQWVKERLLTDLAGSNWGHGYQRSAECVFQITVKHHCSDRRHESILETCVDLQARLKYFLPDVCSFRKRLDQKHVFRTSRSKSSYFSSQRPDVRGILIQTRGDWSILKTRENHVWSNKDDMDFSYSRVVPTEDFSVPGIIIPKPTIIENEMGVSVQMRSVHVLRIA